MFLPSNLDKYENKRQTKQLSRFSCLVYCAISFLQVNTE